ncbi:hypothetical protein H4Q26_014818 [Puccinia striiformis f. sp. tritici PST-130]|nr:hypothetical protein H4Q26_014818 [Puccinia striiformis f. sp. tritici PST-130]
MAQLSNTLRRKSCGFRYYCSGGFAPTNPAQLSTGASIAPRSPMPKKKGGGGRGGRGGRPGTGGIKGGGDRGLRTVGGGGGVGDPRLTEAIVVAVFRREGSADLHMYKAPLMIHSEMATADATGFPAAEDDVQMAGDV